ncbi:MAG: 4Fe-4S dicluster domain-containing protein [Burkholderiaceae bacterium]|nr:4Fe-4S dicluster domain-containing protein [Burkholderiaceae bacterium]
MTKPPDNPDRRSVLQRMAASVALAGAGCTRVPDERIVPYERMPEAGTASLPVYYATAFVRGGFAHGVLVGTKQGRPIKIEGNPTHPSSLGATDVFAQASVLQLWDPDRSPAVVQRGLTASWGAFDTAWRAREAQLLERRGEGLRLLTPRFTSPTLRRQVEALLERFPRARWHRHDPLHVRAADEGARSVFGRVVRGVSHFDRARFVVSLGADPFSEGPACVRNAIDWSARRADDLRADDASRLARLVCAETTRGLFGARADERLVLAPARIDALARRLAAQLYPDLANSGSSAAPTDAADARVLRWAARLKRAGAQALVVAGPLASANTHAIAHLLNLRLGAGGTSVDWIEPPEGDEPAGSIDDLADAMHGGDVDTLLILDGNPVYDAPARSRFADALRRVEFSAHLSLYRDETSEACTWHLPRSHDYEQWSDSRAFDGSVTVLQPAIAPLYDTRSAHELLAVLAADPERDGREIVRATWRGSSGPGEFDARWRRSLRAGTIESSAYLPIVAPHAANRIDPAAAPSSRVEAAPAGVAPASAAGVAPAGAAAVGASTPPAPPAEAAESFVAVFVADASVDDGAFANNAWLQELPRPFTKLTWENAAFIGPGSAVARSLATGDVVRIVAGERALEAPLWVQTGHAEGVVSLPLGYGRRSAGRVGSGLGFDAYALRDGSDAPIRVQLERTGRRHSFAVTQHTIDQHGRALARVVAPGERIDEPVRARPSLYPPIEYPTHAWAMAIDLDACIGCNACTIACQAENNIPVVGAEQVANGREMHWIRVDRYEDDAARTVFQPVPCMHCENAPCEVVCPVGATVHDSEGLNVQVYNRCIGTRFCSNNCPYKVRRFNFLQWVDESVESLKGQRNPDVTVRHRGVMEKCTYCLQRITRARLSAEREGRTIADGEVITACQAVCPTRAIHFGDGNDAKAEVVRVRRSPRHYALLGELNTRPRTTYLARVETPPEHEA